MWGPLSKRLRWLGFSLLGALSASSVMADEQPREAFVAPLLGKAIPEWSWQAINWDDVAEGVLGEYWIGVHLGEVPEIAKAQLQIDHGLATIEVMPDGPARKAGVELHDILLRVGDKPLREPIELVRAVNEAKDQKIELTVLRGGKERTLELQPEKRPAPAVGDEPVARVMALTDGQTGPELAQLERALRALQGAAPHGEGLGMWFVRPPILTAPGARLTVKAAELPADVQVTIQKKGREPASVVVKRGDKSWDATEDKLEALPEDVREAVARMLGKGHVTVQAQMLHGQHLPQPVAPQAPGLPAGTPFAPPQGAPFFVHPHPGGAQVERRVVVVDGHGDAAHERGVSAKLDLILKKLELLEGGANKPSAVRGVESKAGEDWLDDLQQEVRRLRKEVDQLKHSGKSRP